MTAIDLGPAAQVHAPVLAAMHHICFREPWSADAFASSLALPTTRGLIAQAPDQGPAGLALWSVVVDQAEILTIAVLPPFRRLGLGRRLMRAALDDAHRSGCADMLLEVADDNAAAQALYGDLGFAAIARRKGYYGGTIDAVMMKAATRPPWADKA